MIEDTIKKLTDQITELSKATTRQATALERFYKALEAQGYVGAEAKKELANAGGQRSKAKAKEKAEAAVEELRAKKAAEAAETVVLGEDTDDDPAAQQAADEAKSKAHTDKQRAEQKAPAAEDEEPAAGGEDDLWEDEATAADAPTIDDVRKVVAPLGKVKGRALLADYGASRLSDLKPEQFAEVIAAAKEA